MTRNCREAYGMYAVNGILFNHESPVARRDLRDPKDPCAAARIKEGLECEHYLGNLYSVRDWVYAKEYVEASC